MKSLSKAIFSASSRPSLRRKVANRYFTSGSCYEGTLEAKESTSLYFRRANDRGHVNFGWLDTKHTFSFAPYYKNDQHRGFRRLRVINDDLISGGKGFETHSHVNMEILSYIVRGRLEHKDSMGNGTIIHRDEIQIMSAGRGVTHSEFNPDQNQTTHLLQIWVIPRKLSLNPSYQQIKVDLADRTDRLCHIACPALEDGTVPEEMKNQVVGVNQDVNIYASILPKGSQVALSHFIRGSRAAWIQVATGSIQIKIQDQLVQLKQGDGVGIDTPTEICISRSSELPEDAEFLLFDLA